MKNWMLSACFCLSFFYMASAQQFEAASSDVTENIENFVGRYGKPERIYLADAKKKTFEVPAGQYFGVAFAYEVNDPAKRRMMIYQVGPKGEKLKILYPGMDKGYRIGSMQIFGIRGTAPADGGGTVTYKVDTNPSATVYMYKLTPGVK